MAEHKLILASVAPGAEAHVSAALSKALGLAEASTQSIVASVPIVLLTSLEASQAQGVLAAMNAVKQAGGNLVISSSPVQGMATVNWPSLPKIGGRDIGDFKPQKPAGQRSPTPAPQVMSSASTITCPHCQKPIAIHVAPSRPASGVMDAAEDGEFGLLPEVPDVQGHIQPPPPNQAVPRIGPMDLEEFEKSVGGGRQSPPISDALLQQLDRAIELGPQEMDAGAPPSPDKSRSVPRSPTDVTRQIRLRDRRRR